MINKLFDLSHRVAVITGGAGMLGRVHAAVIAEAGGIPVLVDINEEGARAAADDISKKYGVKSFGVKVDITQKSDIERFLGIVLKETGRIDILINNAANNPMVKKNSDGMTIRFEDFTLDQWNADISVGLTGAFLCSQAIGKAMAEKGGGVILNISSDLGVIAPDQRLYAKKGLAPEKQPVKPVTYSVVKHGIIGLSKYLATYWAGCNIRVNTLCPGGVYTGQSKEFLDKICTRIPMGRMAAKDEYQGAVLFLVSDASAYMTGANLIVDGGRTCW
ncbi:MAG: SDR family oxidoreductase [Sedimentisphaerales bacterium]|jgi:NAD(P)-dependent dehydrogenase (short-subunit alcohol dehydrogenase family)